MTQPSAQTGNPAQVNREVLEHLPKKHVMGPVHTILGLALRGTRTHFEEGARDDINRHKELGGSLLILMTHFSRMEPLVIGQMARGNKTLNHLQYNTGITARRELGNLPFPLGYIVRNSGAQFVDRIIESPNETPEEKTARQERNQRTQAAGGRFLASGRHWLIFPEGGSRDVEMKDGKPVLGPNGKPIKQSRAPGELLPVRMGLVYTLADMTQEERAKVKMMGIAVHYGDRRFATLRPTVAIPRLVDPLEGDYSDPSHRERVRQQGEDLLRQGVEDAVRLDGERR